MIFLKWIYFKRNGFIQRSWKLWLEGNSRQPLQSAQEALKGNTVSGGGWLSLKECWQGQWLQKPLVQAFQKKPSTLPGMYLDNHRDKSQGRKKGWGSPRLAPDDVMPPPRMPVKAVCFGQIYGGLGVCTFPPLPCKLHQFSVFLHRHVPRQGCLAALSKKSSCLIHESVCLRCHKSNVTLQTPPSPLGDLYRFWDENFHQL